MSQHQDQVSIGDFYSAIRGERQQQGEQRREQASADYDEAKRLARQNGLELHRLNETHYQLSGKAFVGTWLMNIYPGNQRLFADRNRKARAPYLVMPARGWKLLDVVKAAMEAVRYGY